MAKRKKRHHTTHRRRRGIGATHHGSLVAAGEQLAGLVIGSMAATVVQRMATTLNPKIIAVAEMAGGMYLTRKASPLLMGVGYGIASAGAIGFSHSLGLIHGLEDMVSGLYDGEGVSGEYDYQAGIPNQGYVSGLSNGAYVSGNPNASMPQQYCPTDDIYNPGVMAGMGVLS